MAKIKEFFLKLNKIFKAKKKYTTSLLFVFSILLVIVFNIAVDKVTISDSEFSFDSKYLYVQTDTELDSYTDLVFGSNEVATLKASIIDDRIINQTLVLRTNFLFLNVYANDELIYSYSEEPNDMFFPDCPKSLYHSIDLPDAEGQLEITMEFTSTDVLDTYQVKSIYVGNLGSISFAIVKANISFCVLIAINLIILIIIMTLFFNYHHTIYKMKNNLILTTIVAIFWVCSDRGIGQLIHGSYMLDYYITLVSIFVLNLIYMKAICPIYWEKLSFRIVYIAQIIFVVFVLLIHVLGIYPMVSFLTYNYLNYIVLLGYYLHCTFIYHKEDQQYNSLRILFIILTTIILVELYFLLFSPSKFNSSIVLLFIAIFNILHIKNYFENIVNQEKYNNQLRLELSDAKTKVLITEIKPHFLYNALNSIRALCTIDVELAQTTINNLAKYFRSNTDSLNSHVPILFMKELEHIRSYISIEQVRFGERIKYVEDFKSNIFYVPSLSIEPLIENAVAHGLSKKKNGGTVTIKTYEDRKNYYVEVTDDGVGFDTSVSRGASSIGLNNSEQRIKIFLNGKLDVSSKINHGTTIKITLPKETNKDNK